MSISSSSIFNRFMQENNDFQKVEDAHSRISPYLTPTLLLKSSLLNNFLGHHVFFKNDGVQKTGSFKIRGVLNALLRLKERNALPRAVVAYSSGNHAQAVAYACSQLSIPSTIYMHASTSAVKVQATKAFGGYVVLTHTRQEAESLCLEAAKQPDVLLLTPYGREDILVGQATFCYEALEQGLIPDAIFTSVGGGGLLTGTWIACKQKGLNTQIFGCEAEKANKAARSLKDNMLFRFDHFPETIADGARPLSLSKETWPFVQHASGIFEISESSICYWTQWLMHLLKITPEPTSALAMAGAAAWLKTQEKPRNVLVLLSGGNLSADMYQKIWEKDYLITPPSPDLMLR